MVGSCEDGLDALQAVPMLSGCVDVDRVFNACVQPIVLVFWRLDAVEVNADTFCCGTWCHY